MTPARAAVCPDCVGTGLVDTGLCARCDGGGLVVVDTGPGLGPASKVQDPAVNGAFPGSSPGGPAADPSDNGGDDNDGDHGPGGNPALYAHDGVAWMDWLELGVAAHG